MAGSLRSMRAGLAPLKQQAPAVDSEQDRIAQSVKTDLDSAAEAIKREVSYTRYTRCLSPRTVDACDR